MRPCSDSSGVVDAPIVVLRGDDIGERATADSWLAGVPYPESGAPGRVIHSGKTMGDVSAAARADAIPVPASAKLWVRNKRRSSNPLPATVAGCEAGPDWVSVTTMRLGGGGALPA